MDVRTKKIVKANKIRKRERLKRNLEDVNREIEDLEEEIREEKITDIRNVKIL